MASVRTLSPRLVFIAMLALGGLLVPASPSSAQGFGIGGRFAWVKSDTEVDVDSMRFMGGQIRLLGARAGLEVSLDHHSESLEAANLKVTETPVQASLLLRLGHGRATPFLLGGPGWYRRTIKLLDDTNNPGVTTTEFGWHAGGGLEVLPSRHIGIHGDYRFTFLDFNGNGDNEGFFNRLIPGHRGSMWTLGATVYF